MITLCPRCGIDLVKDEPIVSGGLAIDPRGDVTLAGRHLDLTAAQRGVLYALVKAQGRAISREAILQRIGAEGIQVAHNHVCHVRKKLAEIQPGRAFIETMRPVGWRWVGG